MLDPKRNFANLRGGGIIRRVVPDEDTGLIHVQQMPVDENDDNDDNDDSG